MHGVRLCVRRVKTHTSDIQKQQRQAVSSCHLCGLECIARLEGVKGRVRDYRFSMNTSDRYSHTNNKLSIACTIYSVPTVVYIAAVGWDEFLARRNSRIISIVHVIKKQTYGRQTTPEKMGGRERADTENAKIKHTHRHTHTHRRTTGVNCFFLSAS